jgi:hypothetical protein
VKDKTSAAIVKKSPARLKPGICLKIKDLSFWNIGAMEHLESN